MIIAIAHILGSIVATSLWGLLALVFTGWLNERTQSKAIEEVSVMLGISVEELELEENFPKLIRLSSERFSSELFKNRFSDLCGLIQILWGWLGFLLQGISFLVTVWLTFSEGLENAVIAWLILGIGVFFTTASIILLFLCNLVTGRYPGEASRVRKNVAGMISNRVIDSKISD